jgi:hypothetical protein
MIRSIADFERRLNELDPRDVAFVVHVDQLMVELSPSLNAAVYDAIFRFFERHTDADCGAPGTLVHHVERYYPNYVDALLESVARKSSFNGVLMINRILNSEIDSDLRARLFSALVRVSEGDNTSAIIREMAAGFVERHR